MLQQAQYGGKFTQVRCHCIRRCHIFCFQTVYFTRHIKQHGIGFRGVEIVVHRFNKARFKRFATGRRNGFICAAQRSVETLQRRTRLLQVLFAIVQLAAIVARHQEVTHGFRVVVFQHIAHGKEVTQRFGHLLAVNHHHTRVHPVVHILTIMGTGGLRDFVFVVREHQV